MDNSKKSSTDKMKIAPSTHNDQLGENATTEFAQDYDNKNNPPKNPNKNPAKSR